MNFDSKWNSMIFEVIHVQSYHGYRGEEYPKAFTFREREWKIESISDRWYEGAATAGKAIMDYFKIKTADGPEFILRRNPRSDVWAVLLV
jgi:hypothetical protein